MDNTEKQADKTQDFDPTDALLVAAEQAACLLVKRRADGTRTGAQADEAVAVLREAVTQVRLHYHQHNSPHNIFTDMTINGLVVTGDEQARALYNAGLRVRCDGYRQELLGVCAAYKAAFDKGQQKARYFAYQAPNRILGKLRAGGGMAYNKQTREWMVAAWLWARLYEAYQQPGTRIPTLPDDDPLAAVVKAEAQSTQKATTQTGNAKGG